MLIQMGAVKFVKSVTVFGKMGGNPIHNNRNAGLMELVNKITKIIRITETAGGSKHTDNLVPPGTVKRMLGHRQKFNMGEAHIYDVRHQMIGQLTIGQIFVVFFAAP